MFQICQNFIRINDDLFLVKRTFPEERIKNFNLAKEWLKVDFVFKREGLLYFCDKIIDLEIIN